MLNILIISPTFTKKSMWTKLTTNEQIAAIRLKTIVVKYPVFVEPVVNFDGANSDNVSPRIVESNKNQIIDLRFIPEQVGVDVVLGLGPLIDGPIHKRYRDIISESIWWVNNG
jgi:hypothetical protein